MASLVTAKLKSGIIFGDSDNSEYLYLPAGECCSDNPLLVYEHDSHREDVTLAEAQDIVTRRSLKPAPHPLLGANSF